MRPRLLHTEILADIGALIIRMGFGGFYYNRANKEAPQ